MVYVIKSQLLSSSSFKIQDPELKLKTTPILLVQESRLAAAPCNMVHIKHTMAHQNSAEKLPKTW